MNDEMQFIYDLFHISGSSLIYFINKLSIANLLCTLCNCGEL